MRYITILVIVFVIMFLAPFAVAIMYCVRKKGKVLMIQQEKSKDARYFGKSFSNLVEKSLNSKNGNTIKLSKEEKYVDADSIDGSLSKIDELVICLGRNLYVPSFVREFNKEIYCDRSIVLNGNVTLRAAYAKDSMIIGASTAVDRWIDAENTIAIYDNCDLGMSATAGKRISIGSNCSFRRLFAPDIFIGQYPDNLCNTMDNKRSYIIEGTKPTVVVRNISVVDDEMVNARNEAYVTVLTNRNLIILENIIVKGDVRTHQGIRLCENAVVCGNIFAEKDIYIGKNAVVLGNVFTQGNIYVGPNVMIGQSGKIVSMIAREKIYIEKNVTVHGFICCEGGGKVAESYDIEDENKEYKFLTYSQCKKNICINNYEDYERLCDVGLRKDELLETVEIRIPITRLPESFCYACKGLKSVECPGSIQEIGSYAFADCVNLKYFTFFTNMNIKSIATSAFENCRELYEVEFPRQLEVLGGAAFAGCCNIKSIFFPADSCLRVIGDHCFRGCSSVQNLIIPDSVEKIGVSAFADCLALKEISIPKGCETQPGILELMQKPEIVIIIRLNYEQSNVGNFNDIKNS